MSKWTDFFERPTTFLGLEDTPTEYDANKFARSTNSGLEWHEIVNGVYPRYYVEPNLTVVVGDWMQYVIHELGYIDIAGTLDLGEGSMVIIL